MRSSGWATALVLGVLLIPAAAQSAPSVRWQSDLDKAIELARSKGRPMLIAMHKVGEIACKRMIEDVYTDPDVVAKLGDFVCLATCLDRHDVVDGAPTHGPCSAFPGITCDQHQAIEGLVRERYIGTNTVKVPQHMILTADGKLLLTQIFEMKKTAFLDYCDKGLALFGTEMAQGMDAIIREKLGLVVNGNAAERKEAVQFLLKTNDQKAIDVLFLTIQGLDKGKDRGACVRAMGYEELEEAAGPLLLKWLRDRDPFVVNCAVVSIEETGHGPALKPLLELYEKTNDKEVKKDIVRALGTVGAADPDARKLIAAAITSSEDVMRIAGYLSSAPLLQEDETRARINAQFKKEGGDATAKASIVRSYQLAESVLLADELLAIVAKDGNKGLQDLAMAAKKDLEGAAEMADWAVMRKGYRPIYVTDRIQRNFLEDWGKGKGPKGGRGGRGGGRGR